MYFIILLLIFVSNFNLIHSDICADIDYDCDACLGNSFNCVWCTDEVHNDITRCRLSQNPLVLRTNWCKNTENPVSEPVEIIKSEDYRPRTETTAAVQLKPQHVGFKARPRQTVEFPMSYKPDLGHPINVYYLFDNSKLSKLCRQHFDTQAPEIYEALKKISGDVQFGIGSLDTNTIRDSDTSVNNKTIFRNILSFTKDISRVINAHDDSDGTSIPTLLEGLTQAMESEEFNGKDFHRKTVVIIFCDPKNDPSANTTQQDKYINKMKKLVLDKNVNLIFIGQKEFPDEYKMLAGKFRGSSYVELNDIDKDHVQDLVNVIKDEYLKTVHNLELSIGVVPPHMSVEITPACEKIGSRCIWKIQPGMSLEMNVAVFMIQCPRDLEYNRTVTIEAIGSHDTLTIDTHALCYCKCKEKVEENSDKCKSMGDYTCGMCKCREGRFGDSCQCIGDPVEDGWAKCRQDTWDYICSNHGVCICGQCRCHEGYEGLYCGDVVKH